MARLPVLSGKEILRILGKASFSISRQKGSHIVLVKYEGGKKLVVVVPYHKEVDPGTLLSIIAQAGMTREQFVALLEK